MKIRDFFSSLVGVGYFSIWYVIGYILQFAPLIVLRFPFWLISIVMIAFFAIDLFTASTEKACLSLLLLLAKTVVEWIFWIFALVVMIGAPQNIATIIYYIVFAIHALDALYKLFIFVVSLLSQRE